ncbi:MAG: CCA tRNA nucleotidyltransferase [Candidatus Cloacimonetes bacterium]|nr:CCA tRNA nucleotidyltransferase [Candidatus Cloacimonadota bacterium]
MDAIRELIKNSIINTEFENCTFLVGGYVRDKVMNRESKSDDMDIVVALPEGGIKLARYLHEQGISSEPVIFENFGTAMVRINHYSIEFVMTRRESYRDKSRKPDVAHGTIEDDIFRRDFTINSLIQNVVTGEILDLSGNGFKDIEEGVIRSTSDPDIIFVEDPLRTLRAIRFAARFHFRIEEVTASGMKKHADKLRFISRERIKDELSKILVGDNVSYGLNLMLEMGIMEFVFPKLINLKNLEQNKYHFGDVWEHTLRVVENSPRDLEVRMAALLHDVGKQSCVSEDDKGIHFYGHELISADISQEMLTDLRYSKIFIANVCILVKNHMRLKGAGKLGEKLTDKTLRRIYHQLGDLTDKLFDLVHADNVSHASEYNLPLQIQGLKTRLMKIKDDYSGKPFPLTGHDVMKTFGIKEGEEIGQIINEAKELWLEHPEWDKEKLLKELLR